MKTLRSIELEETNGVYLIRVYFTFDKRPRILTLAKDMTFWDVIDHVLRFAITLLGEARS